ncbi:MAG: HAMP domain-containing sensor histidine kinase [Saccharofermentanales bacterium]
MRRKRVKSILLQRILFLFITTVILFVLLTSTLYVLISRVLYTNIKAAELTPKAQIISSFVVLYRNGEIPYEYFANLISSGPSAWDAWVFVLDEEGSMIVHTTIPDETDPEQSFIAGIESKTAEVLSGKEIQFTGSLPNDKFKMMIVGVPIIDGGTVAGAVFLAKPLYEINAGINSLNGALLLSTLVCLVFMIFPTVAAVNRLIRPLKETRDAALAMANGDFSVRAKTSAKGEIGDLAESFNLLAERLEKTISDLVTEKNRLMRILNGLAEGIIAVDVQCNVTHANPALWKLIHTGNLGLSLEDMQADTDHALVVKPNNPQFIRSQVISDESVWDDFRNVIHTAVPITRDLVRHDSIIRIMITPIADETGRTSGAVALLQDITEAELLEQTRKDYVANISHELRTPLTAMRGLVEPLADGLVRTEEDRLRYYGIILRETLRLSRLIEDMMELSRLQSGKITIDTKVFNLNDVIEDLLYKYVQVASDKGITLEFSDQFRTIPQVIGNPDRIEQVLIILIDNALKFTPSGGRISVDVRPNRKSKPDKLVISVRDTGIGIEPENIANVFDRFFKADKARYGTAGTGLGLSIAKEILTAMGEGISVSSVIGKGSVFTFTLSIKKQQQAP